MVEGAREREEESGQLSVGEWWMVEWTLDGSDMTLTGRWALGAGQGDE